MGTRLKRSWGQHISPGKSLPGTHALQWSSHLSPDSWVILMKMLMILEVKDRRTWNPELLTGNVNSSHMYPSLTHLETGLDEGKDRPLQNYKIQFTLCLLQLCLYSSVCVLSFLLRIQICLLQDGQVEGNYQNLLLIKILFPSGLLISPVYAKENN